MGPQYGRGWAAFADGYPEVPGGPAAGPTNARGRQPDAQLLSHAVAQTKSEPMDECPAFSAGRPGAARFAMRVSVTAFGLLASNAADDAAL